MQLLKNEKFLYFAGGVVATLFGLHAVKTGKARRAAVAGLACGMKLQKQAMEQIQNMKEEATDICHDALKAEGAAGEI
jgi:hypothetical protein